MAQVSPMTKETEAKLTQLLTGVVDSGAEPIGALTKIAQKAQLTPDQIRLLGRAYNTGVTLNQIKEGNTIQEKAAIVTLVDPELVIKNVFPENVDTPAIKAQKTAVASDYTLPPSVSYKPKRIFNSTFTTKAAAAPPESCDPNGYAYLNKRAKEKEINCTLDEGRRVVHVNIYKAAQAFDNLRDYFERAGAIDINYVQKNAATVYGDIVNKIFNHITQDIKLTKKGSDAKPAINWNIAPFSFIKDAIEAVNTHNAFKTKLAAIENIRPTAKKKNKPNGPIMGSIVDYLEKESTIATGLAGGAGMGFARKTLDSMEPKPEHEQIQSIIRKLDSGGHASELQKIKMQSFLTELMLSDPVVSEHDPDSVYDAFNYLNEIAPRSIQHPVIAKSLIRRYLSQGNSIDPYEVSQLTTMERDLMQQSTRDPVRSEMALFGASEGRKNDEDS